MLDTPRFITLTLMLIAGMLAPAAVGLYPRLAQGETPGQRNYYHLDDELYRRGAGQLFCLCRLERRRLSDEQDLRQKRLPAALGDYAKEVRLFRGRLPISA